MSLVARRLWRVVRGESQTERYLRYIATKEYNNHLQYWNTCRLLRGEVLNFMGHSVQLLAKIKDERQRREEESKRFDILKNIFSLQNLKQLGTADERQREQLQRELQAQLQAALAEPSPSPSPSSSSTTSTSSSTAPPSTSTTPSPTPTPSFAPTPFTTLNPIPQEEEYNEQQSQGITGWLREIKRRYNDTDDFEAINIRFLQSKVEFEKEENEFWSQLPYKQLKEAFQSQFPTHAFNPPNTRNLTDNKDTKGTINETSPSQGIPNSVLQQLKERQALKDAGAPAESIPKIDLSCIPKETLEQLRKQYKEKSTKDSDK